MKELISLDEYKTYKGISSTDDDSRIIQILTHVSGLVRHFCNRSFNAYYTEPKVETHDGCTNIIYLEEMPLNTVTSVEISEDGGTTYSALETYYVNAEDSFITTGTIYPFVTSPLTINGVKVTYTGGYQDCPEDLKIACFDIAEYYKEEEYIPKKVMSGATSDNEVFRLMRSERFPIHIQRVLNLYRSVI